MGLPLSKLSETANTSVHVNESEQRERITIIQTRTPVQKIPGFKDPRSPSDNIIRTPIDDKYAHSPSTTISLTDSFLNYGSRGHTESPFHTPKRVGVLETNLDYEETDIDAVFRTKRNGNSFLMDKYKLGGRGFVDDPRSPTVGITRTPIRVDESEKDESFVSVNETTNAPTDLERVFETVKKIEMDFADPMVSGDFYEKISRLEYNVDLDKIIRDYKHIASVASEESHNEVSEVEKTRTPLAHIQRGKIDNRENRTPLRDLKGDTNKGVKMQASKVSKIPVLKNRRSLQCENTPPVNKGRWDNKDSTIII